MSQLSSAFRLSLPAAFLLCTTFAVAAEDDSGWRDVDPARTAVMQLPGGDVIIRPAVKAKK